MGIVIFLLMLVPAVFAGLGYISPWWMIISLVLAYGRSIVSIGKLTGDFREQTTDQFLHNEKLVKMRVFLSMLIVLAVYFVTWLVA